MPIPDLRPPSPGLRPLLARVYLVGAGPGDPGLITLRGVECLARADVVLYDYLVNAEIVEHAPATAERICLGKHGRTRVWTQDEINARLIADASAGKTVVRLKCGDPAVFACYAEEVGALAAAGIPFEAVPGISAALAAGSFAGIPITHREFASAAAIVTGHEDKGKTDSAIEYGALAKFPGTLVFYMGVTTAPHWTQALIAAGKSPATPAAIVRRVSFPDQRVLVCRLDEIVAKIASEKVRPPVLFIVGEAVTAAEALAWYDKRPLSGVSVLVTRGAEQARGLVSPLRELGAETLVQPAIKILPPKDWSPVDAAISDLRSFDWLVFSSSNGVQAFLDRLLAQGRDLRAMGNAKLAVIGPGTAAELERYHLRADLIPMEYRAEALADALAKNANGQRFLLLRASRGREVLAEQLTTAGGHVTQVVVYQSLDVPAPDEDVQQRLREGRLQWITVTSSAIARSLIALFGDDLRRAKLVSISPLTSEVLREAGFEPAAEAAEYTMGGVVRAILAAESRG